MNIQEQNVPQSYRDLFATIPEKSNFFYEYARHKKPTLPKRVYVIQGFFSLTRETDDNGEKLIPTYQLLAQKDFFYKSIEYPKSMWILQGAISYFTKARFLTSSGSNSSQNIAL